MDLPVSSFVFHSFLFIAKKSVNLVVEQDGFLSIMEITALITEVIVLDSYSYVTG